jgi:hypothetical protein
VFRLLEDLPHLRGQVDGRVIVVVIVDADVVFESDDQMFLEVDEDAPFAGSRRASAWGIR